MLQFDWKSLINETGPRLLETCATPDLNLIWIRRSRVADYANIMIPHDCSSENNPRMRGVCV